ncbi:MAG: EamA domain [Anaerocolumna sp.]|jgi:drug/metabolite transporter (DMT)-like permease|nr:EamA domain [Anaerocolumna sp.]
MKDFHNIKGAKASLFAILAASLYAINSPISKLLLIELSPTMMAALLYIGAGIGLTIVVGFQKSIGKKSKELSLAKRDIPYTIGMIVLDIVAPILLMIGLKFQAASNASLLNNFEIVATSIIAMCIFKEVITKRLWIGIFFITVSSFILTIDDLSTFSFSFGSIFVLLACICWGFENNCTRKISERNPLQIVIMKGFFSGIGSLLIAVLLREITTNIGYIFMALCLGFVAYGLSILFYIYAQRDLGAAKTSAYYAIAPFIGALLSLILFREIPSISFLIALIIMLIGTYYTTTDQK